MTCLQKRAVGKKRAAGRLLRDLSSNLEMTLQAQSRVAGEAEATDHKASIEESDIACNCNDLETSRD